MSSGSDWPTFQADSARTGHHPHQQAPEEPIVCRWTHETVEESDISSVGTGIGYGSASVVDGKLYFSNGSSEVYALDAETGDESWRYRSDGRVVSSSSPTVTDEAVFVGIDDVLLALDPETGDEKWSAATEGGSIECSPTLIDGNVVVRAEKVYARDTVTGAVDWSVEIGNDSHTPPVAGDETVYLAGDDSIHAIRTEDGSRSWSVDVECAWKSTPTVSEDHVFVVGEDEELHALRADTGSETWSVEIGEVMRASPAVANGTIFIARSEWTSNELYAIDTDSGEVEWTFGDSSEPFSSAAVVDGTVLVGQGGRLYAVDAVTGREEWSVKLRGSVSLPAVADETVFVESNDRYLYALETGSRAES